MLDDWVVIYGVLAAARGFTCVVALFDSFIVILFVLFQAHCAWLSFRTYNISKVNSKPINTILLKAYLS